VWKSTNQRGIKNEMKEELKEEILKIKEEFKEELKEELKKSRGINVEFKCGYQKTSNKLKQKNKNLGCLVEKMSQVLR
jgi:5-methylthioribose kinase